MVGQQSWDIQKRAPAQKNIFRRCSSACHETISRCWKARRSVKLRRASGAPYQTEIATGTLLVTTGLYGIYPSGIPVGRVQELATVESGWEKSYMVEPLVRPELVDVALVWLRAPLPPDE